MGETWREWPALITKLANTDPYPQSVPINNLVQMQGTPPTDTAPLDPFEFVRRIAVARITMPRRGGALVARP
jgi:biotin synthase